jgi:hypothetical protein
MNASLSLSLSLSLIRATSPAHLILLDQITRLIFGEKSSYSPFKSLLFKLYYFVLQNLPSVFSDSTSVLQTKWSLQNQKNLVYFHVVGNTQTHKHKTRFHHDIPLPSCISYP